MRPGTARSATRGGSNTTRATQTYFDYVAAVDPTTLKTVDMSTGPTVFAIAARVGATPVAYA